MSNETNEPLPQLCARVEAALMQGLPAAAARNYCARLVEGVREMEGQSVEAAACIEHLTGQLHHERNQVIALQSKLADAEARVRRMEESVRALEMESDSAVSFSRIEEIDDA